MEPFNRSVLERPSFSGSILRMDFISGLKTNGRIDGLGVRLPVKGSISSSSHSVFRPYLLDQSSVYFVKSAPVKAGRLGTERLEKPFSGSLFNSLFGLSPVSSSPVGGSPKLSRGS